MYTIDKQNSYMLAEYIQGARRGSALERTPNKRKQHDIMNSGGFLALSFHFSVTVL